MFRNKIILLGYIVSIALVWGFCFLDNEYSSKFTLIIGMTYPFIVGYYLFEYITLESLSNKLYLISLVLIYFFYFAAVSLWPTLVFLLISPVFFGCLLLIIYFGWIKEKIVRFSPLLLLLMLFYTFSIYPYWIQAEAEIHIITKLDNFYKLNDGEMDDISGISLSNFKFINTDFDTINIVENEKYVMIKTWNENCPPCIKAFIELDTFFSNLPNVVSYNLYESRKLKSSKLFERIFNYQHIKKPRSILIDVDQKFYKDLYMSGYPYFVLFDLKGKIIYKTRGYSSDKRQVIINDICELVGCD